jgi:hypothetical protein
MGGSAFTGSKLYVSYVNRPEGTPPPKKTNSKVNLAVVPGDTLAENASKNPGSCGVVVNIGGTRSKSHPAFAVEAVPRIGCASTGK